MRPVNTLVAFDFDGVMHENPHWAVTFGAMDFSGIRIFQRAGYQVAVMTCNDIDRVAKVLRRARFRTFEDHRMRHMDFPRGMDLRTVLVTGRKVAAAMYLDDRGYRFRFGDDWDAALAELRRREAEPERELSRA